MSDEQTRVVATFTSGFTMSQERVDALTGELRFFNGKLQQRWVNQLRCWIDWQGRDPKYAWKDVPEVTGEDNVT